MSGSNDRDPILASAPPPYSTAGDNPAAAIPNEPPPKYEPPKAGYDAAANPPPPGAFPVQGGYQTCQPNVVLITTRFGPHSQQMQCPHCMAHITTTTDYQAGGLTWLSAGLICLFGCWLGCCLIPFCIGDLQDVTHKCPNCSRVVGVYRRLD